MEPSILITGFTIFIASFFIHVIWWRWWQPKSDIFALILVFFIIPIVFIIILRLPLSIAILHLALSSAYIMGYPTVQAGCPSLDILLIVKNSSPDGITRERIKQLLGGDVLVELSIKKMIEEGLAREVGDELTPTRSGNLIASFFILFRYPLGIGVGGG